MKIKDIKEKSEIELINLLKEKKKELFNLRFQKSHAQITDTSSMKKAKKNVARILTILNNKIYLSKSNA